MQHHGHGGVPRHHQGSHSCEWEIGSALYEGIRTVGYKDIGDLIDAIEKISEDGDREAKT